MRIALLAMTGDELGTPRIAGQPVIWHQLHAALVAGCERVICLAQAPGPALAALQRDAEVAGAKFHPVSHPRALSGLVHAADTLYVFAPAVMVDREWLVQALAARAGVAVLPAERAIAQGYERIDRERAWGGVLATRGDAVEALAELPPDADPVAGLLRVALQRGARTLEVPEAWLDEGRWALVADPSTAGRFETQWYARRVPSPDWLRPGEAGIQRLMRNFVSGRMMRAWLPRALASGGAALAVCGALGGYLGYTVAGLATLVVATIAGQAGSALDRFARAGTGAERRRWPGEARDALFDLAFVAIASSPSEFAGWPVPFAALVLLCAVRLAREEQAQRFARIFGDRTLVFAVSLALAAVGPFGSGLALLGLSGLAARLFLPKSRS